ncbi:xanthine dehydrogenase [Sergentomyia squamirostris]
MEKVSFKVNGVEFRVNPRECPPGMSLNTFLRTRANLTGTKSMCLEGGCGACTVVVRGKHPVSGKEWVGAVNSCLMSVYSCHGVEVTTIEGVGNRQIGYHPVQTRLAQMNGTQCGYCSPGMVMTMLGLLENQQGRVTMTDVEKHLGGNICRCTGYRPILDAFKSLADIEDLPKLCPRTMETCSGNCQIMDEKFSLEFPNGEKWFKVQEVKEVFEIFSSSEEKKIMLVAGNTGHGVFRRDPGISILIDVKDVKELRKWNIENFVELGGSVTLTEMREVLTEASGKSVDFSYCQELADHLEIVGSPSVRNMATIAGNLMLKHSHREFSSDIFLMIETVGGKIEIAESSNLRQALSPPEFLETNMERKIITKIILPGHDPSVTKIKMMKIMQRAQNTPALVNAGFLLRLSQEETVEFASISFGCINDSFVHATNLEAYLLGKNIFSNRIFQAALKILEDELKVTDSPPNADPEYRKLLALGLFYRFILSITPNSTIPQRFLTGSEPSSRSLSSGQQTFKKFPERFPITDAIPKWEGTIQTAGEAKYANDLSPQPGELWAAFVQGRKVNAIIKDIDPSPALAVPGVHFFFSAKDIPGSNTFAPGNKIDPDYVDTEEIFCSKKILFNGQPVGIILADSFDLAQETAKLVKIEYEETDEKILPTIWDVVRENAKEKIRDYPDNMKAKAYGNDTQFTASGHWSSGSQYHLTMEPQTCICLPTETGMEVYSSTQWMDLVQIAIADTLKIPENSIHMIVRRLGGGFGSRISRGSQIACATALACYKTNRPVRLVLTMEANMEIVGKRYPCIGDYSVDVDSKGKIQRLTNDYMQDFGCSSNESVIWLSMRWFQNCYDNQSWDVTSKGVFTNSPSNTYCRAPGIIEGMAMIENIMEHIAKTTGLDPVDVRLANIPEDSPIRDIIADFVRSTEYEERKKQIAVFNDENRWKKRGISIVPMKYPQHFFGTLPAMVSVYHGDGTVAICHGGIEMGQGLNTKAAQVAAKVLGIPLESITFRPVDNMVSANCTVSGGSSTSEGICLSVLRACEVILERIRPVREELGGEVSWKDLVQQCYKKNIDLTALYVYRAEEIKNYDIWGVTCAEVEVDVLTGNVQILRVDIVEDTGESLNPLVDVGQIEGSFVMGLGYWLHEEIIYRSNDGKLLTNRTWNYRPPGARDIPVEFRVTFLQQPNPNYVLKSKATGEPALAMTCVIIFAIRQALFSSRRDAGLIEEWCELGAPSTPADILLKAGTKPEDFLLRN